MRLCKIISLVCLEIYLSVTTALAMPAFPGATGFGSQTEGGRGGYICQVASLADSGANTLRDCIERSGPRIVVFRVSGHIILNSPLIIKNPYITIAGQTAPGEGILLRKEYLIISTHDVIVRNIRVRVGDEAGYTSNRDGINISTSYATSDVYNVIIDRCSVSWGIDENLSTWISSTKPYKVHDITIQWSIISEGLNNSVHVDEGAAPGVTDPHSMAALLGPTGSYNISFHHNLLAHNKGRNPRIDGVKQVEILNNIFYNWGDVPTEISSAMTTAHIVGNYYKNGTNSSDREIRINDSMHNDSRLYIENNYMDSYKVRSLDSTKTRYPLTDQHAVILQQKSSIIQNFYTNNPPFYRSMTPLFASILITTSAQDAYSSVLSTAGAYPRDSVDKRIVHETINRTGSVIDSQNQVGGWPIYVNSNPPLDSDDDGLPDSWDGLGRNASDLASSGYTWIEEYINSTLPVGDTPTPTTTPKPGDLNTDGSVNLLDFNLLITNFGSPYTILDFNNILTNFGK